MLAKRRLASETIARKTESAWALASLASGAALVGLSAFFSSGTHRLAAPLGGWMMERFPVHRSVTDSAGVTTEILMDNTAVVFPIVAGLCLASALVAQLIRR